MVNLKEFRFVLSKETLGKLKIDSKRAKDFNDYYLLRNKRVRHFLATRGNKEEFVLIVSEPGRIVKRKISIDKKEANELMKQAELIIKKNGIGHFVVEGYEGYIEVVSAFESGNKKPFVDEIQVEFELDSDKIPILKKILKPSKIIEEGMYDYMSRLK